MTFGDPTREREAEPGAALPLRRNEGLEQLPAHGVWNSASVVADEKHGLVGLGRIARGEDDEPGPHRRGLDRVEREVHDRLMEGGRIDGDRRHGLVGLEHDLDATVAGGGREEVAHLAKDGVHVALLGLERALLGPGEHVEREGLHAVEVPLQDRPALLGLRKLAPRERELDGVGAEAQPLQHVLDRVAEGGHGLADEGKPFLLAAGADLAARREGERGDLGRARR